MNNIRKINVVIFTLLFMTVFTTVFITTVNAQETTQVYFEEWAENLKKVGMFKGSENGFELDREPTRVEGAVLLVRLLGKESLASEKNYSHPFQDVPQWASPYIGYLYNEGLTDGISSTEFGSTQKFTVQHCLTYFLRVLGYNDSSGDFHWSKALDKAVEIELVAQQYANQFKEDSKLFLRDDAVALMTVTLKKNLKNSDKTLVEKLIDDGILTLNQAIDSNLYNKSINIEKKGIVRYTHNSYETEITVGKNDIEYIAFKEFENEQDKRITQILVSGDDLIQYSLILDKDHKLTDEDIYGKIVSFKGKLMFEMYSSKASRYIHVDELEFTELSEDNNYEYISNMGILINEGNGEVAGTRGFTFKNEDGEKYNALFGGASNLVDDYYVNDEPSYASYNLSNFLYKNVWIGGYIKKDTNILIVDEFSKDYKKDVTTAKWIKIIEKDELVPVFLEIENITDSGDVLIIKGIGQTTYTVEDSQVIAEFDKSKYTEKLLNDKFIGKDIIVYAKSVEHNDSDLNAKAVKWDYESNSSEVTSNFIAKVIKKLDETFNYVEFSVISDNSTIEKIRFAKNKFTKEEIDKVNGINAYFSGKYTEGNLNVVEILEWINM